MSNSYRDRGPVGNKRISAKYCIFDSAAIVSSNSSQLFDALQNCHYVCAYYRYYSIWKVVEIIQFSVMGVKYLSGVQPFLRVPHTRLSCASWVPSLHACQHAITSSLHGHLLSRIRSLMPTFHAFFSCLLHFFFQASSLSFCL